MSRTRVVIVEITLKKRGGSIVGSATYAGRPKSLAPNQVASNDRDDAIRVLTTQALSDLATDVEDGREVDAIVFRVKE